jgi:hypothetical protein
MYHSITVAIKAETKVARTPSFRCHILAGDAAQHSVTGAMWKPLPETLLSFITQRRKKHSGRRAGGVCLWRDCKTNTNSGSSRLVPTKERPRR